MDLQTGVAKHVFLVLFNLENRS